MNNYPDFKRGEAQTFFNKLPLKERQLIENYVKYVSITSKSKARLENSKRSLIALSKVSGKALNNLTLDDLRSFLALLNNSNRTQSTRNELKHTIKRFLKWHFKDWSERFQNLEDIKLVMRMNEEKINADTILKKDDIEKIMKAEPKLYWKTFFISLYESGLRPGELRKLTWKDIKFDVGTEGMSEINVFATKTHRARSVYVKEASFYLKKLKEQSKNDLVFPAPRDPTKPVGKELPAMWLKRISKRVIGRQVYPYILRHSRATELYTNAGIPDKTAQKFLGHSKSMGDVYTHLSNTDVKEAVANTIYKLEDIPEEKKHQLEIDNEKMRKELANFRKELQPILEERAKEKEDIKKMAKTIVKQMMEDAKRGKKK